MALGYNIMTLENLIFSPSQVLFSAWRKEFREREPKNHMHWDAACGAKITILPFPAK